MVSLSICVPAYEAGRTLEPTLRSILSQDADFELLVLDNASTDATGEIAASFGDPRLRLERNETTLPIGDNWNRAIRLSTGDLVKVVCADDILLPGSLNAQLEIMSDPRFAISSSRFQVIDESGTLLETGLGLPGLRGVHSPRSLARTIVRRGPADFGPTAAAMFRREHFDRVGGLRGDLVFPMDVDLFARVGQFGLFFGLTEVAAAWRDSTFNLCSQTSTVSKLMETLRFHHRLARDCPRLLSPLDIAIGDLRLARTALQRLGVRASALLRARIGR
ncbi:glycosyltransferase family 2 protein [Nocardia bovistercoris]|uniref:Glycosyltransferase n=1 Tax=Nocardia bovistercoris TaxID=2785916 RepID=A0A931N0J5_9NOCA|nr:glycosyltransferase [Nocardia bovistercoris]